MLNTLHILCISEEELRTKKIKLLFLNTQLFSYKTQTQSIHSDSVTPSPTGGYGSDEPHLPDHSSDIANRENNEDGTTLPSGLVWAVTDISNVPIGSILINPQTLQPILNADG